MSQPRWTRLSILLLILFGGSIPIVLDWWVLGRVPTLSPQAAIDMLTAPAAGAIVVDVRDPDAFSERHLEASQNWPLEQIKSLSSRDQVPGRFSDRTLLLLSGVGFSSREAVQRLQALGLDDVYHVHGGLQGWIAAWDAPCASSLCTVRTCTNESADSSFRAAPLHEQAAQIAAGFVVKPVHMLLTFALILVLWRHRSRDLTALRWGLIFFLAGELFCMFHSLTYLFFHRTLDLLEYLHGFGMVLAFAFSSYALIEGLDARAMRLTSPGRRCAALDLCGPCIKYEDAPCGARRVFLLLMPLHIVLAAVPLFVPPNSVSYNTVINQTFYNYSHLFVHQMFETRYCPILSMLLIAVAFLILWRNGDRPATNSTKVLFAAGVGAFGFSIFRTVFTTLYLENLVWFNVWEEVTELLYVAAIAFLLWVFRRSLFQSGAPAISSG